MTSTFNTLVVLLVAAVSLASSHPEEESLPQSLEEAAVSGVSGEQLGTTQSLLELEESASWSTSAELEDETAAMTRRRRSTGQKEVAPEVDLEEAETVVFNPHFLRVKRKKAHSECQDRNNDYALWSRQGSRHPGRHTPKVHCNGYCCYPLIPQTL